MTSIKQIHGLIAYLDFDLRHEIAALDLLKSWLDPITLGLRTVDLARVCVVREAVNVIAGFLILFLLVLISFRVRWKFDRDAVVSVTNRMNAALECCYRIRRRKNDRVFVIYRCKRLLNDKRYGTIVPQPTVELCYFFIHMIFR